VFIGPKFYRVGLVMGPGQKILTRVGSGQFFVARVGSGQVGSAIYGLGLNLKNFPKKCQIFQFFSLWIKKISSESTRVKGGSAIYLLRVKSKLGSDQGPSLGRSRLGN